jgi:hypothetical protein
MTASRPSEGVNVTVGWTGTAGEGSGAWQAELADALPRPTSMVKTGSQSMVLRVCARVVLTGPSALGYMGHTDPVVDCLSSVLVGQTDGYTACERPGHLITAGHPACRRLSSSGLHVCPTCNCFRHPIDGDARDLRV